MVHSLTLPPPGFDELTLDEKLDYVNALWERITVKPNAVPTPSWHLEIARERQAAYERNPGSAKPWHEVRDRILADLKE